MNKPETYKFACPSCKKSIRVPVVIEGKLISCPGCAARFSAPRPEAVPEASPELPKPPKPKPGEPTFSYRCDRCGHLGETGVDNCGLVFTCPCCARPVEMPALPSCGPEPDPEEVAFEAITGHKPAPLQVPEPDPEWVAVKCPHCQQEGEVPRKFAGKRIKCLACGKEVFVGTRGFAAVDDSPAALPSHLQPGDGPNRFIAGFLAFFLGALGIHKFYMSYGKEGCTMLLIGGITLGYGFILTGVIGGIEAVTYWTMSDHDFYETYVAERKGWF